ncbi:hypothetical protein [Lactobacillus taiwanensis]|uniref:hypothetical protein n=3 Tax=Lactobacillus taiwanensis TaxID=508451 RepID=UPI000B987F32|nr:hypothetical protein [Lactobacillus taiwanensis]OYS33377.1 hypothetical protein CBF78_06175 [Lactobacillus taiwanensis]
MKKEDKITKFDSILTRIEYGLISFSAGLISFYICIIALTLLSEKWKWLNNDSLAWTLIIIVGIFSVYICYLTWRKIDKSARWATLKINIIMYHLNTIGQNIIFWFIWLIAMSISIKAISNSSHGTLFNRIISLPFFNNINTILTSILGVLSIFNFGKITVYKLSINWNITCDNNKKKINIWATNVGSGTAAYRLLGIYRKEDIDRIYQENNNWVLAKNLKELTPLYCGKKDSNFENLSVGCSTNINRIFMHDIREVNKIEKCYIVYESSLEKIEIKEIDLKE